MKAERPEAVNLIGIFSTLANQTTEETVKEYGGQPFSDFKKALTDVAVERLGPIGTEMKRLMADEGHVDAVLKDGAERAAAIAEPILNEVQDIVGFLRP